jgi:hypothetical protein
MFALGILTGLLAAFIAMCFEDWLERRYWRNHDPYEGYDETDNDIDNKTHEYWLSLEMQRRDTEGC